MSSPTAQSPGTSDLSDPIEALASEGQYDSEGAFTLDEGKAREKLRRFQLADPVRYVLEFVQAATLKRARLIAFEIDHANLTAEFDGEPFRREDFTEIFGSLWLKPRDRSAEARRHLALGLCTALQLEPGLVRVESDSFYLELRPNQPERLGKLDEPAQHTRILVRHRLRRSISNWWFDRIPERAMLLAHCSYSRVQVQVNQEPLSSGLKLEGVVFQERFAREEVIGSLGFAAPMSLTAQGGGSYTAPLPFLLVRNGVFIDAIDLPEVKRLPGFVAVIESPRFKLDLSHEHVIVDEYLAGIGKFLLNEQLRLLGRQCMLYLESQDKPPQPAQATPAGLPLAPEKPQRPAEKSLSLPILQSCLRSLLMLMQAPGWKALVQMVGSQAALQLPMYERTPDWPLFVPNGVYWLDIALFQATDGQQVTLRQILADFKIYGSVAYSLYESAEALPERPLVIRAAGDRDTVLLRTLFADALANVDAQIRDSRERAANIQTWRRRPQAAQVMADNVLVRTALFEKQPFRGEVALTFTPVEDTAMPWLRLPWDGTCFSHIEFIKEGCLLAAQKVPFAIPNLYAAVEGDFNLTYRFDALLKDDVYAAAVEQVHLSAIALIPLLLPKLASCEQRWFLARSLRGLLKLAAERNLFPPLSQELMDAPLWETCDGQLLSLTEIRQRAGAGGVVAMIAQTLLLTPDALWQLPKLFFSGETELFVWQQAHRFSPGLAPSGSAPALLLWLDTETWPLFQKLKKGLAPTEIVDGRAWIVKVLELYRMHGKRQAVLALPPDCTVAVSLPKLEGKLGVRPYQQRTGVSVRLHNNHHPLGERQEYLPAGPFLDAVVDHPELDPTRALEQAPESVMAEVRLRLAEALPALIKAICQSRFREDVGLNRVLTLLLIALFPHPVFRAIYDAMREVARGDSAALGRVEETYRQILGLAVATSVDGVASALLEKQVSAGESVSILALRKAVWRRRYVPMVPVRAMPQVSDPGARAILNIMASWSDLGDTANEELSADETEEMLAATEPPLRAMDWVDVLYPDSADLPMAERALRVLPELARAPLFRSVAQKPLTFLELSEQFGKFGSLCYCRTPVSVMKRRPDSILLVQDDWQLEALRCLFGPSKVYLFGTLPLSDARARAEHAVPSLGSAAQPAAQAIGFDVSDAAPDPSEEAEPLSLEELSFDDMVPAIPASSVPSLAGESALSREELLLRSLVHELHALGGKEPRLLRNVNLGWLRIGDSGRSLAVVCGKDEHLINRRHPAVQAVLEQFTSDPQQIYFLASAVYTALNIWFEEVTDEDEAHFHHQLVRRVLDTSGLLP